MPPDQTTLLRRQSECTACTVLYDVLVPDLFSATASSVLLWRLLAYSPEEIKPGIVINSKATGRIYLHFLFIASSSNIFILTVTYLCPSLLFPLPGSQEQQSETDLFFEDSARMHMAPHDHGRPGMSRGM